MVSMHSLQTIKTALISVSDKSGIVDFAKRLVEHNIQILSTGGSAKLLREQDIAVTEVSSYTGFPEMMDGRIKTLHPKIHGGILARRGTDDAVMQQHAIQAIDLLVVNLYPFESTIAKADCQLPDAIENIDIGGPAMLRAAAKNHQYVSVVSDPQDYAKILQQLDSQQGTDLALRYQLACKAFAHTAKYDAAIADYLAKQTDQHKQTSESIFPDDYCVDYQKIQDMRYGENPHQSAAFYREKNPQQACVATATQLQGKALSFNNVADSDAALECVKQFAQPACVIVKHANPCGVAVAENICVAYQRAYQTDPTSAFGGIIAVNQLLDHDTAKAIVEQQFVEVIIAPEVSQRAKSVIAAKGNIRLLECGYWQQPVASWDYKKVVGGLLIQDRDLATVKQADLKVVTKIKPDQSQIEDLLFCWKVAKSVKSNAIVYAKNQQTIGIGAGQMSRVYSAKIAGIKAKDEGLQVAGSVMASDAFFPFRDGIDAAAQAGISAVIQPGGSMRDQQVIDAADQHGIAMVFTGMRHFKH